MQAMPGPIRQGKGLISRFAFDARAFVVFHQWLDTALCMMLYVHSSMLGCTRLPSMPKTTVIHCDVSIQLNSTLISR
jgi:hypothetical protein